jgi:hypothetical protein
VPRELKQLRSSQPLHAFLGFTALICWSESGTQWDGFRHFAHIPSKTFYNGTKGIDIAGPKTDDNKCGIHHWAQHGIVGRGVLIDYWSYANEKGIIYGVPP